MAFLPVLWRCCQAVQMGRSGITSIILEPSKAEKQVRGHWRCVFVRENWGGTCMYMDTSFLGVWKEVYAQGGVGKL